MGAGSGKPPTERQRMIIMRIVRERVYGRRFKLSEIARQAGCSPETARDVIYDYAAQCFDLAVKSSLTNPQV